MMITGSSWVHQSMTLQESRSSRFVSKPSSWTHFEEVYEPFLPFIEEKEVSVDQAEPYFNTNLMQYQEVLIHFRKDMEDVIDGSKFVEDNSERSVNLEHLRRHTF